MVEAAVKDGRSRALAIPWGEDRRGEVLFALRPQPSPAFGECSLGFSLPDSDPVEPGEELSGRQQLAGPA
jgi:hypothetical protein